MRSFSVSIILLLVAVICFVLAAFGIGEKFSVNVVDIGLAFFAGSFLLAGA